MSASVGAVFEAIDTNHDGVISMQEFEAATVGSVRAPATYVINPTSTYMAPQTYVSQPAATYISSPQTYVASPASYTLPVTYSTPQTVTGSISYSAPLTVSAPLPISEPVGSEKTVVTLAAGEKVMYTARHDGQKYAATLVERNAGGWLLKLDVDGGVKEVPDFEIWRIGGLASGEEKSKDTAAEASKAGAPARAGAPEMAHAGAPEKAPEKKEKKSKKVSSKKRGCC
eukprot:TRINITY_DN947_c0_g1_i11.p1 TRINITY_DN947_c0_g1~~TRINITY_DN947_c0_g1_i11.p1  ORF type:complete len:228 (+),score=67.49 TRINITY_DN947_c0_g1_i11:74-757(+)